MRKQNPYLTLKAIIIMHNKNQVFCIIMAIISKTFLLNQENYEERFLEIRESFQNPQNI